MKHFKTTFLILIIVLIVSGFNFAQSKWKPVTDWGHWILGHKSDFEFLKRNNMTVTFGSGAPNFDEVSRAEFDSKMEEAKKFNKTYHDSGFIVLRYLSTSLNGNSESNKDTPLKNQINYLKFYNEMWNDFADYIGPKPEEDPTTWIMVYPDGSFPYYRYAPYGQKTDEGFEAWGVPVNPNYLRVMEGKVRAQAETGIDGSYIDWTHIAEGTSYDKYSRQGFIKYLETFLPPEVCNQKYGISDYTNINLPVKRGDKFWMEWITYRGYQVAEFHKHLRNTARKYNPDFMISGNVFGGFGFGPIAYLGAGNMELLARDGYDDFIYSEIQEYLDSAPGNKNGVKITNSPALKFLTAVSHGKPVIVYATEITPPIFPNPTEKCLSAMSQINIAEAVANHCIFREKRETPPGATAIYEFLAGNRHLLTGAQLYSNIAVLASLKQYLADEQSFAFSTSRVLTDRGIDHNFIVEDDLENNKLEEFNIIILPYLPLMSTDHQKLLVDYAEKGGTLFIIGQTGVKNQYNLVNKSNHFLETAGLKVYPSETLIKQAGSGKLIFIPLKIPEHKYLTEVKSNLDATTFGSSMVNIFADVPEAYTRNKIHPELRELLNYLAGEIEKTAGGSITKLESTSPFIEISTMINKSENAMLVHLVNYDVTIEGDITPVKDIKMGIKIPEGYRAGKVSFSGNLGVMNELKQEVIKLNGNNILIMSIPTVEVYGLAVIELKNIQE
jgi:hypothetical protein